MKKLLIALFLFAIVPAAFAGCGSTNDESNIPAQTSETIAEQSADPSVGTNAEPTQNSELASANASDEQGMFDLEKGTVIPNNGIEIPIVGIGTFTLSSDQAAESVYNPFA
jgi:hypothetical protein